HRFLGCLQQRLLPPPASLRKPTLRLSPSAIFEAKMVCTTISILNQCCKITPAVTTSQMPPAPINASRTPSAAIRINTYGCTGASRVSPRVRIIENMGGSDHASQRHWGPYTLHLLLQQREKSCYMNFSTNS